MNNKVLFQIEKFKQKSFCTALFTDLTRIENLENSIKSLPKNSIIIFREYNLNQSKRQVLATKTLKLCKKLGHKLLIGKDLSLAQKIKADGVHFSDLDNNSWNQIRKNHNSNFLVSLACHSQKSIIKAQKSKSDILFLSPIFATKSHKNAKTLGLANLRKSVAKSQKPIFALGGICQKNINSIIKSCASGFGAIDFFNKIDDF